MPPRWKVIVRYNIPSYVDDVYFIEELSELHAIIEHGPDWRLIEDITISLNR